MNRGGSPEAQPAPHAAPPPVAVVEPQPVAVVDPQPVAAPAPRARSAAEALEGVPGGLVPQRLHFIWSGRRISEAALTNIHGWGKRAARDGWEATVWTDAEIHDWDMLTRLSLRMAGIRLEKIDRNVLGERLWGHYTTLMHSDPRRKNYPAASDLARYAILKRHGGVYADVDISPGEISLAQLAVPRRLPIVAPEIRDAGAVRYELRLEAGEKVTRQHVIDAALRRLEQGFFANSFIATPADSPAMDAVIDAALRNLTQVGGAGYLLDMPTDAAVVTGPNALKIGLLSYLRHHMPEPEFSLVEVNETLSAVLQHTLPIGWLTPESEQQEH